MILYSTITRHIQNYPDIDMLLEVSTYKFDVLFTHRPGEILIGCDNRLLLFLFSSPVLSWHGLIIHICNYLKPRLVLLIIKSMYFQNSNFLLAKEGNAQEDIKIVYIPKIIALKFLTRVSNMRCDQWSCQTPDGKTQALRMLFFSQETVKLEDLCYLGFYFVFLVQWKNLLV